MPELERHDVRNMDSRRLEWRHVKHENRKIVKFPEVLALMVSHNIPPNNPQSQLLAPCRIWKTSSESPSQTVPLRWHRWSLRSRPSHSVCTSSAPQAFHQSPLSKLQDPHIGDAMSSQRRLSSRSSKSCPGVPCTAYTMISCTSSKAYIHRSNLSVQHHLAANCQMRRCHKANKSSPSQSLAWL